MGKSPKYSGPSAAEIAAQQQAQAIADRQKRDEEARLAYERQASAAGLRGMRALLAGASGGGTLWAPGWGPAANLMSAAGSGGGGGGGVFGLGRSTDLGGN